MSLNPQTSQSYPHLPDDESMSRVIANNTR